MAKKIVEAVGNELEKELAAAGLADIFQKIVDRSDMNVDVLLVWITTLGLHFT